MLDHITIQERLNQLERARSQDMELINLRFEQVEMKLDHIGEKIDMMSKQVDWICRVLSRRFTGMPGDEK